MSAERDQQNSQPPKLKLPDKIWVAGVIAAFVVIFILIVIYDVL